MGDDYSVPFANLGWQFRQHQFALLRGFFQIGRSGSFILGEHNNALEKELEAFCGVNHVVAVGNGSDAITLGLMALGVGPGDEVITVPHSFIATVWPIVAVGARPVFVDVGADGNIRPDQIEPAISEKTKAVIAVHLAGHPADIRSIKTVIGSRPISIIEDCAQSIGTKIDNDHVGTVGDLGTFSLHPLKNLGVLGDGGFVTTNDPQLADRIRLLRNHGLLNRDEMVVWGVNSRLDEIQAYVARVRLKSFTKWARKLESIAGAYRQGLGAVEGWASLPTLNQAGKSVLHNFVITVENRDDLRAHLAKMGVETKIHYPIPIHLQEGAGDLKYGLGDFPQAESLARTSLSLPFHPGLKPRDIRLVVESIREFFIVEAENCESR